MTEARSKDPLHGITLEIIHPNGTVTPASIHLPLQQLVGHRLY